MPELRIHFHRDLDEIDARVTQLFALVGEGLAAATDALLAGDRDAARSLMVKDSIIDGLYRHVEDLAQREFALQTPMATDLRFLLSVLRIVPELERSGDLVEHIALRAARGLDPELTPRIRGLVTNMGRVGVEMWRMVADAYAERDAGGAAAIDAMDDQMDELHLSLTAELSSGVLTVPVAIEMALVARFYERLGDHAVNIAKRIGYLAIGDAALEAAAPPPPLPHP
jgi:phosphate transport system protein